MKKVLVAALAVALAAVMVVPASAFENEFGGYFRVRAFNNTDFAADGAKDVQKVDTRTRLYYTAKFSDNLKFVNKFEIDNEWGTGDLGDVGADGKSVFEVKNTYLDMNFGGVGVKVGTHGATIARGFIFDDDFSGLTVSHEMGSFHWIKMSEGGVGKDRNDFDTDAYVIAPVFSAGSIKVNPYLVYVTQEDSDMAAYDLGFDLDMAMGATNAWVTAVYQGGDADKDNSFAAYLAAVGADAKIGALGVHGQAFYASGQGEDADDIEAFHDLTGGQSYYWAEIMGYGIFDDDVSSGSPADKISNITAVNVGASMSINDKLSAGADLWYAMLNEDNAAGDADLGTEIDLSATYKVMENLNIDVVAAYLVAGDATGDDDPYEVGAQLSLSF